jgi:RNA polymerase sigma-70 factor (ECF subfamily)
VTTGQPDDATTTEDEAVVAALRSGDEAVFVELVRRYQRPLVRLALAYVGSQAVAEEVVQDTWIAVIRGIDGFEGRSSLRTWVFRILTYQARSRGERERRTIPLSAFLAAETGPDEPAVDPARFRPPGDPRWPGHWTQPPGAWASDAEAAVLGLETRQTIATALAALAPAQRLVMTLRDVEGWDSDEVCAALDITAGNQRVLLHRARSKVRASLERYFGEAAGV